MFSSCFSLLIFLSLTACSLLTPTSVPEKQISPFQDGKQIELARYAKTIGIDNQCWILQQFLFHSLGAVLVPKHLIRILENLITILSCMYIFTCSNENLTIHHMLLGFELTTFWFCNNTKDQRQVPSHLNHPRSCGTRRSRV